PSVRLDPILIGAAWSGLTGLVIALLFGFSTITLNVLLVILLAVLVLPKTRVRQIEIGGWQRPAVILGLVAGMIGFYGLGRYALADYIMLQSQESVHVGNLQLSVKQMQRTVRLNPFERVYRMAYSYGLGLQADQVVNAEQRGDLQQQAVDQIHRA